MRKKEPHLLSDFCYSIEALRLLSDIRGVTHPKAAEDPSILWSALAHALADSPVGQLAWSYQLFGDSVSDDYILTNATIYWLTNTAASSARLYYENAHATDVPTGPTTVPLGLANFAFDFQSIRPFAERNHKNIVSWHVYDSGGHNATQMTPDLLINDIRQFFRMLRTQQ